jgi:hypothetical protein
MYPFKTYLIKSLLYYSKLPAWPLSGFSVEEEKYFNDDEDDIFHREEDINQLHCEEEDFDEVTEGQNPKGKYKIKDYFIPLGQKRNSESDLSDTFEKESEEISNLSKIL